MYIYEFKDIWQFNTKLRIKEIFFVLRWAGKFLLVGSTEGNILIHKDKGRRLV